jgi:hypothetical protein
MSSVTLDETAVGKLKGLAEPVQVRDEEGKVIGFFRPAPRVYKKGEIPEITEEEWERSISGQLFTTEEVLRQLDEGR